MFELAQRVGVEGGRIFGPGFIERDHHFWFGPLFGLVMVAILVAGAILITRMLVNRPSSGSVSREPMAILEDRFARGEIDEKEFKARREALRT
jgi:putative membrane protein